MQRTFMPKEVLQWYKTLPELDQNVISIAIQKQLDERYNVKKEKPRGKTV